LLITREDIRLASPFGARAGRAAGDHGDEFL
jgi:hypothetical protein